MCRASQCGDDVAADQGGRCHCQTVARRMHVMADLDERQRSGLSGAKTPAGRFNWYTFLLRTSPDDFRKMFRMRRRTSSSCLDGSSRTARRVTQTRRAETKRDLGRNAPSCRAAAPRWKQRELAFSFLRDDVVKLATLERDFAARSRDQVLCGEVGAEEPRRRGPEPQALPLLEEEVATAKRSLTRTSEPSGMIFLTRRSRTTTRPSGQPISENFSAKTDCPSLFGRVRLWGNCTSLGSSMTSFRGPPRSLSCCYWYVHKASQLLHNKRLEASNETERWTPTGVTLAVSCGLSPMDKYGRPIGLLRATYTNQIGIGPPAE
eukprot:IDg19844t1